MERTLCDLLRGTSAPDVQLVNPAMKAYAKSKDRDVGKLLAYAKLIGRAWQGQGLSGGVAVKTANAMQLKARITAMRETFLLSSAAGPFVTLWNWSRS